jgi:ubiquinone/menaquinone biosynthesis C-methylase UbiE
VLDIGCGTGRYAHLALERGLDVWAIEPSREMRERAAASISSERLSDASVIDLPFDDGRFSFAYQIEVLRYLDAEDNNKAHREILRVLKPGGWYFGTYVNCFALDGYWFKVAFARVKARMRGSIPENHVEFETPSALKRKLVDCGFADVEIHGAMWAPLRILFKVSPPVGEYVGRKLLKFDEVLSDTGTLRAFAGHLVVIARR